MAVLGAKLQGLRSVLMVVLNFALAFVFVSAERGLKLEASRFNGTEGSESRLPSQSCNFFWQSERSGYQHVWPVYMGAAASTVYYNLKLRHPTLELPIIDYDLALLIQPMLMLGISIGVAFNVIFADGWSQFCLCSFIGTSTKAFLKGVETWKKETILKREATRRLESTGAGGNVEYKPLPSGPANDRQKETKELELNLDAHSLGPVIENVAGELGLLVFVWVAFLALQMPRNSRWLAGLGGGFIMVRYFWSLESPLRSPVPQPPLR
ncbi:hypothetical protein Pyn_11425 [Prunus yedoensis var. nudiflora]|uniref:Uncharacterized protein n=1 Tax=Prunus yedoensis var. nudiflora TaxID=2094558 RepID=A0A314URA0_PRUYE|nr:hypothetical protein Pyn_11425 [Prunus yedoensis var. nudiflora]